MNISLDKAQTIAKTKKGKSSQFKRAADKVADEMLKHFKKDGWDLDYSHYVHDVFYVATGVHLETYLHEALRNKVPKNIKLSMTFGNQGNLVFRVKKKAKKR